MFKRYLFTTSLGFVAVVAASLSTPARAKDADLPSSFTRSEIRVNGIADEWTGRLFPLGDRPIQVGVQNDRDFVYICLTTKDSSVRMQLTSVGADIWINGAAKKDQTFGVRFPTGPSMEPSRFRDDGDRGSGGLGAASSEIEILLGKKVGDRIRIPRSTAAPFEAALGEDDGMLVVELKVPLRPMGDRPNAVGAEPGQRIALGLFIGAPAPRPERDERLDAPPGHSGGMGGTMGPGRGTLPPMRSGAHEGAGLPKPIKVWLNVTLAAAVSP